MRYDHVEGIIEILAERELAEYIAEELPYVLVAKYGSWKLRNNTSLDNVDQAMQFLNDMFYDVRVRRCSFSGSPFQQDPHLSGALNAGRVQ